MLRAQNIGYMQLLWSGAVVSWAFLLNFPAGMLPVGTLILIFFSVSIHVNWSPCRLLVLNNVLMEMYLFFNNSLRSSTVCGWTVFRVSGKRQQRKAARKAIHAKHVKAKFGRMVSCNDKTWRFYKVYSLEDHLIFFIIFIHLADDLIGYNLGGNWITVTFLHYTPVKKKLEH